MAGTIACPQCQCRLHLPEQVLGRRVKCPECKNIFKAESKWAEADSSVRRAGFGTGPGRVRITVRCPNPACRRRFTIGEQHAGATGPCSHCGTMMRVPLVPKANPRPAPTKEESNVEIVDEVEVESVEESSVVDHDDFEVIEETEAVAEIEELESAEEDGSSEARKRSRSRDDDDDFEEDEEEEEPAQQRKKKKGKFKRRRKRWRPGLVAYLVMAWLALSLISFMPLPGSAEILFAIKFFPPIVIGVGLLIAGGIGFTIVAFNEEGWLGFFLLWLFGPWYQLKLLLTHWAYVKIPFLLEVMGFVIMGSGILCTFLWSGLFAPN